MTPIITGPRNGEQAIRTPFFATPAVAAGLTDHVWTWREWFTHPAIQPA